MKLVDLISLLGLAQGLLLGVLILFSHRRWRPTLLLGLFILTLALRILPFLLTRTSVWGFDLDTRWVPLYFWYASLPLLYLYTLQLADGFSWRRDSIHLLPGALEFIFVTGFYVVDRSVAGPLFSPLVDQRIFVLYVSVAALPAGAYTYLIFRWLSRTRNTLLHYYSDLTGKDLRWIQILVVYLFVLGLAYLLLRTWPEGVDYDAVILFGAIGNTLGIYYASINGYRQMALLPPPRPAVLPDDTDTRAPQTTVEESDQPVLYAKVEEYMTSQRPYLNPQLSISDLCAPLGVSERTLSRTINRGSDLHFNGYVNRYRIDRAQQLLLDPNYDHFTMEGIATEAGFNNKATFYRSFKMYCDVSPATYRKLR